MPYADPNHYQRVAGRLAPRCRARSGPTSSTTWPTGRGTTRPRARRYWRDTDGWIDAFVAATGTGGTLGGTGRYLKEHAKGIRIVLADPQGSSLFNWVTSGELKPNGPGSITEGIGIGRVTANLEGTPIDSAVPVSDQEAVETAYRLLYREGLFLGSASGVNVAAAARVARDLGRATRS